jgi:Family of unknown function (DUF5681)
LTAGDRKDDSDKAPPKNPSLSEEVVERIKEEILFGVGYKRPPEHTRFKKGQSGNPRGRPKSSNLGLAGSQSVNSLALKEGQRRIPVREGDEIREIPAIQAVMLSQLKSATGGSAYAQKHYIQRFDWAERENRERIAREIEVWEEYVSIQRRLISDAQAKGQPLPSPLPHPDDVIIDYETGVRFVGPLCDEDVARMQETLKVRDALILQDELDRREISNAKSEDPLDGPGTAMVWAMILNQSVPKRFRLSEGRLLLQVTRYQSMPKRVLLKEVYRSWRAIGARARRGRTMPPLRVGKQVIEETIGLIKEHCDPIDVSPKT